jgi:hypothetical protein
MLRLTLYFQAQDDIMGIHNHIWTQPAAPTAHPETNLKVETAKISGMPQTYTPAPPSSREGLNSPAPNPPISPYCAPPEQNRDEGGDESQARWHTGTTENAKIVSNPRRRRWPSSGLYECQAAAALLVSAAAAAVAAKASGDSVVNWQSTGDMIERVGGIAGSASHDKKSWSVWTYSPA